MTSFSSTDNTFESKKNDVRPSPIPATSGGNSSLPVELWSLWGQHPTATINTDGSAAFLYDAHTSDKARDFLRHLTAWRRVAGVSESLTFIPSVGAKDSGALQAAETLATNAAFAIGSNNEGARAASAAAAAEHCTENIIADLDSLHEQAQRQRARLQDEVARVEPRDMLKMQQAHFQEELLRLRNKSLQSDAEHARVCEELNKARRELQQSLDAERKRNQHLQQALDDQEVKLLMERRRIEEERTNLKIQQDQQEKRDIALTKMQEDIEKRSREVADARDEIEREKTQLSTLLRVNEEKRQVRSEVDRTLSLEEATHSKGTAKQLPTSLGQRADSCRNEVPDQNEMLVQSEPHVPDSSNSKAPSRIANIVEPHGKTDRGQQTAVFSEVHCSASPSGSRHSPAFREFYMRQLAVLAWASNGPSQY